MEVHWHSQIGRSRVQESLKRGEGRAGTRSLFQKSLHGPLFTFAPSATQCDLRNRNLLLLLLDDPEDRFYQLPARCAHDLSFVQYGLCDTGSAAPGPSGRTPVDCSRSDSPHPPTSNVSSAWPSVGYVVKNSQLGLFNGLMKHTPRPAPTGRGQARGACFKSHSTAHFGSPSLFATYVRAYSTHHNG